MQGLDKQWNFLNNGLDLRGVQLAGDMERIPFILGFTTNAGGTQATIEETGISAFSVYAVYIKDVNGVEAKGNIAAISTPVNIDTSALDPNNPWTLHVQIQRNNANPDLAQDNGSFGYVLQTVKSAAQSFNNTAGSGTVSIQIEGGTIADAGAFNVATTAAVSDVVIVPINILNTATAKNGALLLETVTATGDGALYQTGGLPTSLAPEANTSAWAVKFDTSTVGAKAITFALTASRSTNTTYSITINLTVA
jgi:hypothetical protein